MTLRIALAGKGGTGKTTLAAALVRQALETNQRPVLAVDADPNSTLALALGVPEPTALADLRDRKEPPPGMNRVEFLRLGVQDCLSEGSGLDLLVMGRPEGPGCYCAVNHLLRAELSRLGKTYPVVIIDNEAGMEHLSRRTTDDIDVLLVTFGPDKASMLTASRIREMIPRLHIKVRRVLPVAVRFPAESGQLLAGSPLGDWNEAVAPVAEDDAVRRISESGGSVFDVSAESAAARDWKALWARVREPESRAGS